MYMYMYMYMYMCMYMYLYMSMYMYRRLGGESNREIVSFRVVRACVRARGAVCKVGFGQKRYFRAPFPFSLLVSQPFPFSLSKN